MAIPAHNYGRVAPFKNIQSWEGDAKKKVDMVYLYIFEVRAGGWSKSIKYRSDHPRSVCSKSK